MGEEVVFELEKTDEESLFIIYTHVGLPNFSQ